MHIFFPAAGVMAVPPSYGDLGKSAKDIFNKGYGTVSFTLEWAILVIDLVVLNTLCKNKNNQ